jgi:hypothetical protein
LTIYNFPIGDFQHQILTINGTHISPTYQMLEITSKYNNNESRNIYVTFRAKFNSSDEWIKFRVAAANSDYSNWDFRDPTLNSSEETDQQGWPAYKINVSVVDEDTSGPSYSNLQSIPNSPVSNNYNENIRIQGDVSDSSGISSVQFLIEYTDEPLMPPHYYNPSGKNVDSTGNGTYWYYIPYSEWIKHLEARITWRIVGTDNDNDRLNDQNVSLSDWQNIDIVKTPITCNDSFEPNDLFTQAYGPISPESYSGMICTSTDVDWFKLNINSPGTISLYLTLPSSSNDFDIDLYYLSEGTGVGGSWLGIGENESIILTTNDIGTYYVKIYGADIDPDPGEIQRDFNALTPYILTYNFTHLLVITGSGNGSVKVDGVLHSLPWSGNYAPGTSVQLEAVAGNGWGFSSWSGSLTGNTSPVNITMGSNKYVTANFYQTDTTPPTGSIFINNNDVYTKTTSVTLFLSASDANGVSQMCLSNTNSCSSWETYATIKPWTLTSGDGTKTVYAWFKDVVGNMNTTPYSDSIILDITAPVDGTLTATAGNGQVSLGWSGFSDSTSGINSYKLVYSNISSPSSCSSGATAYSGAGTSYNHTGLTGGMTYYYRVCAIDNANNTSTGVTANATLQAPDTTGPSLSITSHNDGQHVTTSNITLSGTASDSGKGNNGIQQVTVNGSRANNDTATGSGTANWSKEVMLNSGPNTITVIAYDNSTNHNTTTQSITIYYQSLQQFPFLDDFSTDKGWTGYEVGGWERGPATAGGGEYGNPDPASDHSATTENYLLGFAIGGDYPNNLVEKSIASPPINCTGQSRVFLKFWRYLNVQSNLSDHAKVFASNDGTNWTQLWENPLFDLTDNQWIQVVFDISSIAANQGTVYIKFTMGSTDSSARFSGWNIDDLEVTSDYSGLMALYVPSGDSPNPNIDEMLIEEGLGIKHSNEIPSDLTDYRLLILSKYEASNQTAADRIKNFVQNGGGAVIMSGTPNLLAGNLGGDLSYIKDWLGAANYGNDGGYGTVAIPNPFGTDLSVNDKVDYSTCCAAAVYNLESDATLISKWSPNRVHSFTHSFGQGRVFYYAGNPGYFDAPENANQEMIDNSIELFEAGLLAIEFVPSLSRCDFNNDGKTDILWRNYSTGENAVWLMNGTTELNSVYLRTIPTNPNWDIVGTGDFNDDGNTDILWRNYSTGENAVWLMNGTTELNSVYLRTIPTNLNWDIVGTGDFNGDGNTDILWRNYTTGENAVWLMNGTTELNSVYLRTIPTNLNWDIVGTGDFNGDGNTDILWRNYSTGENAVWLMNGTTELNSVYLRTIPTNPNWDIVGPK